MKNSLIEFWGKAYPTDIHDNGFEFACTVVRKQQASTSSLQLLSEITGIDIDSLEGLKIGSVIVSDDVWMTPEEYRACYGKTSLDEMGQEISSGLINAPLPLECRINNFLSRVKLAMEKRPNSQKPTL